jgi:diguanylate cyclase (GGDEF)-like protein
MAMEVEKLSMEYLERTGTLERRMRNIFLGSMALSLLVFLHFVFLIYRGGGSTSILRISFPALFLWSLTITGYAFYTMWRVSDERRELLEDRVLRDPKTGARSLTFIKNMLEKELERALQTRQSTAVIYVDLEKLDVVNQKFGHTVGDIVLREITKVIDVCAPTGGVVGHVAGDEFVVVLPGTSSADAQAVADDIAVGVRGYTLDLGKRGMLDFLGCQVGVVAFPDDAGFPDEIISIAQQAAVGPTAEPRPLERDV